MTHPPIGAIRTLSSRLPQNRSQREINRETDKFRYALVDWSAT